MPLAQISALKPVGSLKLDTGMSAAGVTVMRPATGARVDVAIAPLRPWAHIGGGAGAGAGVAAATGAAAAGAAGGATV